MSKKRFPFDDAQWDAIVQDAFAEDAPTHRFSDQYCQKKHAMLHQVQNASHSAGHRKKVWVSMLAAAAAVALVPTTVFAVNQMHAYFQKSGNYQQNLVIESGSDADRQPMNFQFGWLPEGATLDEGYTDEMSVRKYSLPDSQAISVCFYKMESQQEAISHKINYVISEETIPCGENTMLCATKDTTGDGDFSFNREAWITFPNSSYVVQLYITTGIADADLQKIAENLSLTPCDTEIASTWDNSEDAANAAASGETQSHTYQLTPIYNGTFHSAQIGETVTDEDDTAVVLNSVQIQHNFEGIATDSIGTSVEEGSFDCYTDVAGNLLKTERNWYAYQDGEEALTQVIQTDSVQQVILRLDLTYTNISSKTQEICLQPKLFWMDGTYLLTQEEMAARKGNVDLGAGDIFRRDSIGGSQKLYSQDDGSYFALYTAHSHQKNNLTKMEPGESADVTVWYLVDADSLQNLYLHPVSTAGALNADVQMGALSISLGDLTDAG